MELARVPESKELKESSKSSSDAEKFSQWIGHIIPEKSNGLPNFALLGALVFTISAIAYSVQAIMAIVEQFSASNILFVLGSLSYLLGSLIFVLDSAFSAHRTVRIHRPHSTPLKVDG